MREHMGLFRGKRIDNGEWVEGSYIPAVDNCAPFIFRSPRYAMGYEVDPNSIGECTGLKDKNGKLIFEGDIVQLSYTGTNMGVQGVAQVVFENGKFGVLWTHEELVCLDGFANTTMEIIGNIHDNPELLKGGEG